MACELARVLSRGIVIVAARHHLWQVHGLWLIRARLGIKMLVIMMQGASMTAQVHHIDQCQIYLGIKDYLA